MQSFSIPFVLPAQPQPIFIPLEKGPSTGAFSYTGPHCFHLLTEEGVASTFLRTVAADVEQARAFVSKKSAIDLDALQDILTLSDDPIVNLKKASYSFNSGKKTRSILLDQQDCILHLHMVEEPDQYGPWKIYGVDRECR